MTSSQHKVAGLVMLVVLSYGSVAWTQSVTERSTCAECRIQVRWIARLGGSTTPHSLSWLSRARLLDTGLFAVAPNYEAGVLTFDAAAGRFVGRWGKEGSGPGEFSAANLRMVSVHDTLQVFDPGLQRVTTLSSAGTPLRTAFMPSADSYLRLSPTEYLLSRSIGTAELIGKQFHQVTVGSQVMRSFGERPGERIRNVADVPERHLAASGEGTFWAHRVDEYNIEKWSLQTGRLISTWEPNHTWFPRELSYYVARPWFYEMREVSDGVITIIRVVSAGGAGRFPRSPYPGVKEVPLPSVAEYDSIYDTVFEYLDPSTGTAIVRGRHPRFFAGFVNDTLVYSRGEEPNGDLYLDIWRIALKRPPG